MSDIQRYKREFVIKTLKRGDSFIFMQFVKGVAIFIFATGIFVSFSAESAGSITPLHAISGEEVVVDKVASSNSFSSVHPFLNAKLINSVDPPAPQDSEGPAIGGANDQSLATIQGSVLLGANMPEIPQIPPQERAEIVTYVVKPGDTALGIAARFGLKLDTLLWSNHFRSIHYIQPGQELLILPADGVLYEIEQGDTLASIAKTYKGNVEEIMDASGIESEEHIFAGQTIIIPGGEKPAPKPQYRAPTPRYASSYQNLDNYFIRPTAGRISQYLHGKNAVDIAGGCWQPIYAAASGTVGISIGNGAWNGGYGSYITINHHNGTRTLYAHNIRNLVWSGQAVGQGEVIGYTGSTGRSSGCHLHWEVHGARNPLAY